ncbi:uncharacterized protein A4U43_C02F2340 [Asparagus officinalis]|uniref:Uncharacterized protein n=1 Tax=Asparagus officinalis TaxID=4686 RepID=A0A5P1FF73_ASPOF|nr:uncharacterized protein A4U43_C02F2340 [Asparagus officinalis]
MATTLTQPARRFTDRSPKSMNQSSSARRNTDKVPKVVHHQPPKSLVPKNPGHASELETQVTLLQEDLTRTKEQLALTETQKRRAQQELEEAKNQLSILSSKYKDLHWKNIDLSASEDDRIKELRELSKERDRAWQSELDALKNQHALDLAALSFASKEIQRLRMHLSKVIESESVYADESETANSELVELKQEMGRTISTVEELKTSS